MENMAVASILKPPPRVQASAPRQAHLDNLKVAFTVVVILAHAAMSYSGVGQWPYIEIRVSPLSAYALGLVLAFGNMFAMGTFFLMAGQLTPASLTRKGTRRFLSDRLFRLGLPLAVSVMVVWPVTEFAANLALTGRLENGWQAAIAAIVRLDPGPSWFLAVLLLFSALYAAYRWLKIPEPVRRGPLTAKHVLIFVALIGSLTFFVRLIFPMPGYQPLGLHVWLWPQCLILFWIGTMSAKKPGWLDAIPRRLRRWLPLALPIAVAAAAITLLMSGANDLTPFNGGWHWQAAGSSLDEGLLAGTVSLWLIDWFRRRVDQTGILAQWLARRAYGAFLIQGPVLVGIAIALRPIRLPGELLLVLMGILGVTGSFLVSAGLVRMSAFRRFI